MPNGGSGSFLKLPITKSRRDKPVKLISPPKTKQYVPNSELGPLIGRLALAQTSAMAKLARAQLRPLYIAVQAFPRTVPA